MYKILCQGELKDALVSFGIFPKSVVLTENVLIFSPEACIYRDHYCLS